MDNKNRDEPNKKTSVMANVIGSIPSTVTGSGGAVAGGGLGQLASQSIQLHASDISCTCLPMIVRSFRKHTPAYYF